MKKLVITLLFSLSIAFTNAQTVIDSLWNVKKEIETMEGFNAEKYSTNANTLLFCLMSIGDYYNAEIVCQSTYDFLSNHGYGDNAKYLIPLALYWSKIQVMLMNYDSAIETLNNIIEVCENRNDYGENYLVTYNNIAQVYLNMGNYKKMKINMDTAVVKLEKIYGNIFEVKEETLFLIINNYGLANYLNGKVDLAEKCFKYVIDNCKNTFESNDAYSLALTNYAYLLIQRHEYKQAEKLLKNANSNNLDYSLKILENLTGTYFAQNKYRKMNQTLMLYNSVATQSAANIFADFPKYKRENYWSRLSYDMMLFNNFVAWYNDNTIAPEIAYNATLFCRNLLSNSEKILENEIAKSSDIILKNKYEIYKLLLHDYTFLNTSSVDKDSLKSELIVIEDNILRNISDLDSLLANSAKTWIDVKNSLDDGEYAIEYVFSIIPKWEGKQAVGTDTIYSLLLIGKKFKRPIIDICSYVKRIDTTYIESIKDELKYNHLYTNGTNYLYKRLFEDIEKKLKNAHTIYYSPCGNLSQLNFDLFMDDSGIPLCQKYKMVRVSSTANIPEVKSLDLKSAKTASLYGGIDYKNTSENAVAGNRGIDFANLPNSANEIKNINTILSTANINTDTLCGTSATEDSFKQLSGHSPDILHVATHGFYLDEESQKPFAQSVNTYSQKEAPMVLSGLALSGADIKWKGNFEDVNSEDGILTAYEISQLDLSNTKLVVLSACETARGKIFPVDGVFGLQRAFKQAGAGAILMSLWKVDDGVTAIFMEHFYKFLFETNDRHKALKLAQDEVKKQFPDPYYWAAWVMLD